MSSWWTDSYMVKPRPSRPVPALPITHWLIPYSLVTQMTLWRHDSLHSGMWYKEKMFDWTPSKWCSYSRSTGVSSVALSPIKQYLTSSLRLKIDSSVWWEKMKQKMHMDLLVYHVCGLLIFHKKKLCFITAAIFPETGLNSTLLHSNKICFKWIFKHNMSTFVVSKASM